MSPISNRTAGLVMAAIAVMAATGGTLVLLRPGGHLIGVMLWLGAPIFAAISLNLFQGTEAAADTQESAEDRARRTRRSLAVFIVFFVPAFYYLMEAALHIQSGLGN